MSQHETPVYITITGLPKSGKTSIANIVGARLRDLGCDVKVADDNGSTILAVEALNGELVLSPHSPVFITTSDRAKTEAPI